MYCKNCGKKISDKALECPACGTSVGNGNSYCQECGAEIIDDTKSYCRNCGCPTNGNFILKPREDTRTGTLKRDVKELLDNPNIHHKSVYTFSFLIPTIVVMAIYNYIIKDFYIISPIVTLILGIILSIPISYLIYNLSCREREAVNNQNTKLKFTFSIKEWLPIFIIVAIENVLNDIIHALTLKANIDTILGIPTSLHIILPIASLIVYLAIIPLPVVIFIALNKNMSVIETIVYGYKVGLKNYWQLLKLQLSFIPLIFLCAITLGILLIWKGFYISVTPYVLAGQLVEKFETKEKIVE